MYRLPKLCALAVALLAAAQTPARADFLAFDTSESPFIAGQENQGYYQRTEARVINSNYYAAAIIDGSGNVSVAWHDFFTFDLRGLDPSLQIVSAMLEVRRYSQFDTQTLQLWDVSTDARVLNTTASSDPAVYLPIFDDLGSGTSYGTFTVPIDASSRSDDILSFALNGAALADIQAAAGQRFFSIGGSLDLSGKLGNPALFSGSGAAGTQRLVLEVRPVPEPGALTLLGLGLAATLAGSARNRRKQSGPSPVATDAGSPTHRR